MKYMIMMFGGLGETLADRSPEWITAMQTTMMRMDQELRESGEVVESRHLTDATRATTVRFTNGAPAPTDGPFAEIKESLAGYWIIEGSYERAVEIASRVVAVTEYPMEVRRVMDEPPSRCDGRAVRGPAARTRAAGPRRARAPARAVRRVRGRRTGGPARRRRTVAPRRCSGPALRLATTVATRALVDHWRSDSARRRREATAALDPTSHPGPGDPDDTLTVLFLCCHPALTAPSQLALTLRAVGGLTTAQVAAAVLAPESTVAQRISRAKNSIRDADGRFDMPTSEQWPGRLGVFLHVLYLMFNEG